MPAWRMVAVVITNDSPSKPSRLYCDRDGRPFLWPEHTRHAGEAAAILVANGLKAAETTVEISTTLTAASK